MNSQPDFWNATRFPGLQHTGKRILIHVMVYTTATFITGTAALWLSGYSLRWEVIKWPLLSCFILSLAFETVWEAVYMLGQYKKSLREQELIRQLSTEQEFEHLKGQVNPHFLFNCFNTLSSLIPEDKERAEAFLDELSKVYRYLLNTNSDGMATVQSEISFIESYLRLLKTRHGDALRVQVQVDRHYYPFLVPSLCLQLLVENAVKHNIVSKGQPLTIEIFSTPARQLIVNNNLQRKKEKERSTRIGLNNIRSKYLLMQEAGFQVVEGEKNFMAVLPMIKNKTQATFK